MDYRLFSSTFILIFLAELGDKTQLAAMARVAGSTGGKWTIFLGASSALVVSTLVAVVLGTGIRKLGLSEDLIRGVAGALFVIMGGLLLFEAIGARRAKVEAPPVPGVLARIALKAAVEFEHAAALDYRRLAEQAREPLVKGLFLALAADEEGHLTRVRAAAAVHGDVRLGEGYPERLPGVTAVTAGDPEASSALASAIAHEVATAEFYEALAADTGIPALKGVFDQLAAEERSHAARLQAVAQTV